MDQKIFLTVDNIQLSKGAKVFSSLFKFLYTYIQNRYRVRYDRVIYRFSTIDGVQEYVTFAE